MLGRKLLLALTFSLMSSVVSPGLVTTGVAVMTTVGAFVGQTVVTGGASAVVSGLSSVGTTVAKGTMSLGAAVVRGGLKPAVKISKILLRSVIKFLRPCIYSLTKSATKKSVSILKKASSGGFKSVLSIANGLLGLTYKPAKYIYKNATREATPITKMILNDTIVKPLKKLVKPVNSIVKPVVYVTKKIARGITPVIVFPFSSIFNSVCRGVFGSKKSRKKKKAKRHLQDKESAKIIFSCDDCDLREKLDVHMDNGTSE